MNERRQQADRQLSLAVRELLMPGGEPPILSPTRRASRRWPIALAIAIILVGLSFFGLVLYWAMTDGVYPGPTLIEELRSGSITAADIAKVEILKWPEPDRIRLDVGEGGDWYDDLERVPLESPEAIVELLGILRDRTTDRRFRSHPSHRYRSLVRLETKDGGYYYLFCPVLYGASDLERDFVRVRSGSRYTVNLNGAKEYENIPLADFLKEHDPWYGQSR